LVCPLQMISGSRRIVRPSSQSEWPVVGVRGRALPPRVPRREYAPLLLGISCALVAFNFGRLNQLFVPLETLPFYRILMPVGLLALLARADLAKRLDVIRTPQGCALVTFVAAMVISVPFSLWPGSSFRETVHYIDAAVPVIILTAAAIRSERDFAWVLRTLVAAVFVLGVAMVTGGTNLAGRLTATTTYDPNDIAMVAVVALPPAVWLLRSKQLRWRALGILGMVAVLVIVTRAASRGGALALAAAILSVLVLSRDVIPPRWRLAVLVVATMVLGTAPSVFWDRLSTLENPTQDYNFTAETGRLDIWKRGVGYFLDRPLNGVGMEQYGMAEGMSGRRIVPAGVGFKWSAAHNMYIQTAAELGILGLTGFLGLFWPTILSVRRASRYRRMGAADPAMLALGQTLVSSIVAFMVAGLFLSAAYGSVAMTLAALGMAFDKLLRRRSAPAITGVVARA